MGFLTRSILASPTAGVGCERVFNIAGDIYHSNQYFDPNTFEAIIILNRHDFRNNINMYRHADLIKDETISKEELDTELARRKAALNDAIKHQYISDEDEEGNKSVTEVSNNPYK